VIGYVAAMLVVFGAFRCGGCNGCCQGPACPTHSGSRWVRTLLKDAGCSSSATTVALVYNSDAILLTAFVAGVGRGPLCHDI